MSTYLIYFGKSQGFTIKVFNENGDTVNIDNVIKDFDRLESKYVTIDDFDNKPIFSKDIILFKESKFTLLKLYSHAQAKNGTRVEGSIYGVGLLSTKNLNLSKINLDILYKIKQEFSIACLNNLKFTVIDFGEDVSKITSNYILKYNIFNKITFSEEPIIEIKNSKPIGYYIDDYASFFNTKSSLLPEIRNEMYFSEDLEHLKRSFNKSFGKLDLYKFIDGKFEKYPKRIESAKNFPTTNNQQRLTNSTISKMDNGELDTIKKRVSYFEEKYIYFRNLFTVAIITNILSVGYISYSYLKNNQSVPVKNEVLKIEEPKIINEDSIFTYKLFEIINDSSKLNKFSNLIYETRKNQTNNPKKIKLDSLIKLYNDAQIDTLNLRFYLNK